MNRSLPTWALLVAACAAAGCCPKKCRCGVDGGLADAAIVDGSIDGGVADASITEGGVDASTACDVATHDASTGYVCFEGRLDACPVVTELTILPTSVLVGATIRVIGSGDDEEDSVISVAWSSDAGSFVSPTSHDTGYVCSVIGTHTVTLTVSDGLCESSLSGTVHCLAP